MEQLGQLTIVGLDEDRLGAESEQFVGRVRPGGIIFFQRNIKTAPKFRRLVEQVRACCETPPFLALDLEGGSVDRLRDVLAPLPAVRDVAQTGMGEMLGRIAGRELAAFSLNVDFAPVLDLTSASSRQVMGSRTAGESPDEVVGFARNFLTGLTESGILGCGKHFPGLGGGTEDSHKELPVVEKDEARMWEEDLKPFRELASELPMIMAAHVFCPLLERSMGSVGQAGEQLPSTLSRGIVTRLLKERIGYKGLVVCDDLEMRGVLQGRTMAQAAVMALKAGCDMLLLCGAESNTQIVVDAVLSEVESDSALQGLVEQAAQKVLDAKEKLGIVARSFNSDQSRNRKGAVTQPGATPALPDFESLRQEIQQFSAEVRKRLEAQAR